MLENSESILGPFEKSHFYWCHPDLCDKRVGIIVGVATNFAISTRALASDRTLNKAPPSMVPLG